LTLFKDRSNTKLSVYFTAGFPAINDTVSTIRSLENAGVDFIEIGFPFSDPLADGPVIQESCRVSLQNGMSLKVLFRQLKNIRDMVKLPLILMGYLNPVLQYGIADFLSDCADAGIDGLILPDLPPDIYTEQYKELFEHHSLSFIPLITPATTEERIRYLDEHSTGFIYMVSSHSTTGSRISLAEQENYLKRVSALRLKNPLVLGFGIQSAEHVRFAMRYCDGAIVGSAFIRHQVDNGNKNIEAFISELKQL